MTTPRTAKGLPAPQGRAGFLSQVWERIKAHKVVQWTLAYLAVAYTLLHGAEMLSHSFSWPHALLRGFAAVLILGIPVVITVAWYHGTYARQRVSATEVMIVAILLAVGGALVWRDQTRHAAEGAPAEEGPASAPAASIAVLPFADLSAEGNQAYFSDGVAEEILNVLAHVRGLKVASRTSSFQFRNADLGVPEIARKLGVRNILEGSVRKSGDTVRISAQLIDAPGDRHLWSQTFDRPLTTANLFGIQDEIASDIVQQLTATLGAAGAGVGHPAPEQAGTASLDVYDLYLKGHALFLARSKANLSAAARLLRTAVAQDPKFARAWESLGAVFAISQFWGLKEEADYNQAALEAANHALAIDPSLSLAYAVRGRAQTNWLLLGKAGSWDEGMADLNQAIARDAQNTTALLWRSLNHALLGYLERAGTDLQRCIDIDPAYETCRRNLAFVELCEGRTDAALRLYEVGLRQDYVNNDVYFARPLAVRGDRIGVLGVLLQQFRSQPRLTDALFRALTDPGFGPAERQEALALAKPSGDADADVGAMLILKAFDRTVDFITDTPPLWLKGEPDWMQSPARKRQLEQLRLSAYWRAHGFPPQCRPVGAADFECP